MTGKVLLMLLSDEAPKCPPINDGWLVLPALIGCAFLLVVFAIGIRPLGVFILNALDAAAANAMRKK